MFCSQCGERLEEKAIFCPQCGTRVRVSSPASAESVSSSTDTTIAAEPMLAAQPGFSPTPPVANTSKTVLKATRVMAIIGILWAAGFGLSLALADVSSLSVVGAWVSFPFTFILYPLVQATITFSQGHKNKYLDLMIVAILGIMVYLALFLFAQIESQRSEGLFVGHWTFIAMVYALVFSIAACIQPVIRRPGIMITLVVAAFVCIVVLSAQLGGRTRLAEVLVAQGWNAEVFHDDSNKAMHRYNEAIRWDPNYALAYQKRGSVYREKDENDMAIADFTQAILIASNDPEAYNHRGIAYSHIGENDKAIADYTTAISLDPPTSLLAIIYNNRGVAYQNKNEYEKAHADFEDAERLNPSINDLNSFY